MTIFLFDINKNVVGELQKIIDYTQKQTLGGTITAEVVATYDPLVEEAYYIGSKDIDDEEVFWLYRITNEKKRDGLIELSGQHILFDELQGRVIREKRPRDVEPGVALSAILEGTGWQVGVNEATGRSGSTYYRQSALSSFWDFLKVWNVEFKPRLTFSGGKITGRYIDIYNRLSDNYGKRYEYGDKLITVEAEQANEGIYTALIGLGKGEETGDGYGRKITFAEAIWSTANGDPVDKPWGQDYVELPSATKDYGFREAVVDFSDIEDPAELLQLTYQELLHTARPKVEFSSSAIETGIVELGETVTVIRDDMGIRYQTRVFELERSFLDKSIKNFRFGDKIITTSAERIKLEREKTEEKFREQQSIVDSLFEQITTSYWGEDGYNYDLRPGNAYGLPAGLYSFNRPIDENPTEVIYIGAGRMLIANSKTPNGEWIWKTAATADGLAGDAIIANSITANKLASDVGKSLDLSSNTSINSNVTELVKQYIALPEVEEMFKDEEKKTYIAYSNSPDGVQDFSLTPDGHAYVGLYQGLDVDSLRGEGENLLPQSRLGTSSGYFTKSTSGMVLENKDGDFLRVTHSTGVGWRPGITIENYTGKLALSAGDVYTISFDMRSDNTKDHEIMLVDMMGAVGKTFKVSPVWSRITYTFTVLEEGRADLYIMQIAPVKGDSFDIKNVKFEKGSTATPWTPAPEDILADIENPSNYNWIPLVPSTITDQFSTIQEALDYMQEIQTQLSTAIRQTSEDISLVASSTGGGNYILNSVGYVGTKYWEATGEVQTWADSWVMEQQARSGFRMGTATLSQEVSLDPTKEYTFILKAQSGGGVNASIKVDDTVLASVVSTESKTISITHQITGKRLVRISIETTAYAGTYLMLTDIGIFLGRGVEGWSQAPTEHYSNTVRIDLDGVVIDEGLGETLEIKSTGMLHRYQGETVLHHSRGGTMLRSLIVPPIQFVDRDTHMGVTYVGRIV